MSLIEEINNKLTLINLSIVLGINFQERFFIPTTQKGMG
jgi:hypothetical protein